jgi:DNA polymerase-1
MMRLRFDGGDRQQVSAARRNGVNMPIQGTSADILKRSLRLLHDGLRGTSGKLVNIVHDEIVVECEASEAQEIAALLENVMSSAGSEFISNVPVKVDINIAEDWTK